VPELSIPLEYQVLGDQGWEEVSLYDGDKKIWRRNLHEELGLASNLIRIRLGGARIKDRYRGAYWTGELQVTGAPITDFSAFGLDHPEQVCWRKDASTIGFRTDTNGDSDSIEIELSSLAGCKISLKSRIDSYVKVGDPLEPQPYVHAPEVELELDGDSLLTKQQVEKLLPGAELKVAIERVTDKELPRDVSGRIDLTSLQLESGREHALFITARQRDQSRVWTSALFLSL
jgi:hypothetical protein